MFGGHLPGCALPTEPVETLLAAVAAALQPDLLPFCMSIRCASLGFMHDDTKSNDEDQFFIQHADPPYTPRETKYSEPFQYMEKNRSHLRVHHLDNGTPENDPPSTPDGCWLPPNKCSDDTYLTFKQAMHQFSIPEKRRWIYSEKEKDLGVHIPLKSVSPCFK